MNSKIIECFESIIAMYCSFFCPNLLEEKAVALLFNQNPYFMKTLKVLFVLCIMLGLAVSAKSQGNQVERPFKGRFYANVVESIPTYEILSINGYATHLGILRNSQMTFMRPPARPYCEGIVGAANGDYFHFYGWPIMVVTKPNPAGPAGIMSGTFYIAGGTGRFTNCYGQYEISGTFDMAADCAQWTADGTITY